LHFLSFPFTLQRAQARHEIFFEILSIRSADSALNEQTKTGDATPAAARRLVEQQWKELSFRQP
jgi:hypothetical protein